MNYRLSVDYHTLRAALRGLDVVSGNFPCWTWKLCLEAVNIWDMEFLNQHFPANCGLVSLYLGCDLGGPENSPGCLWGLWWLSKAMSGVTLLELLLEPRTVYLYSIV
jgi:hypothetical protein